VVVVDINEARIAAWNSDKLPIFEPGLEDVVKIGLGRNLVFSTEVKRHVADADIIFVRRAPCHGSSSSAVDSASSSYRRSELCVRGTTHSTCCGVSAYDICNA